MLRSLILCCCAAILAAQSAADLLAEIDNGLQAEDLAPGSTKRAEAIAELVTEDLGLPAAEVLALRLALAEAWLGAGRLEQCQEASAALVTDPAVPADRREAAALLWIAAWQEALKVSEDPDALPAPASVWPAGTDLPLAVRVRALTAEAARHLQVQRPGDALTAYDQALVLLKDRPAEERVPLYVLRLLAMELPEPDPEAVKAWIAQHQGDPALAQVASAALTAGQQLVGQMAPPLKAPRIDGKEGEIDLAKHQGKVVLLDFFASWCQPCVVQAPAIAAVVGEYRPKGVVALGVSFDRRETAPNLPAFLNRHGIDYPVGGDLLGWDGELDDAYHVDGIPAVVIVGRDGRVAAVDLIAADPAETAKRLRMALEAALDAGQAPAAGGQGFIP